MRKVKNTLTKRLLAMLLCVVMVAAMLPAVVTSAATDTRVADNSTVKGWEDMFGASKLDTEYAGAVWTDKSVFTELTTADFDQKVVDAVKVDEENSFLVALSALAATKEIKGYSTLPTDTVLVLDLSQSMDNSNSVPSMINAANGAIKELLELNNYNRVGVVLYSGNSDFGASSADTATILLPVDRYVAVEETDRRGNVSYSYLDYSGNGETSVMVAQGLKNEAGEAVGVNNWGNRISKTTTGGTYMQNGLYQGWKAFEAVTDTEIATGNIQGGTKRIPIMVLMSDGAPTTANSAYAGTYGRNEAQTLTPASLGTSNAGNGGTATNSLGFLTQLTAAWAKAKMEEKYGREAKFYTLGLDLASQDADGATVAAAVLNPTTSNSTVRNWWSTVAGLESSRTMSLTVPGTGENANNKTVAVSGNSYLTSADQMLYVDRYFPAENSSALNSAFQSIVDEIILQSKYYPTLVEGDNHDTDGYITFEDELGEFMEVKEVEGLVIGDMVFTGAAMTKLMAEGDFGNASQWTPLGQEMLDSVAERLNVDYETAATLASLAWRDGQLSYDAATGAYSNYIGWYSDADNNYLGFWDTDHTELDYPDGTVYINRSYGFYGQDSDVPEGDMMHIIVMVSENVASGHQKVTFKIPTNLIPMVSYNVSLEGTSLANAKNVEMTIDSADPIHLLVEVGLREEVNELTIHQIAEEIENDPDGDHHLHKNADGTYSFYTNRWGSGDGQEIDYTDPTTHTVTVSHYTPSVENERYYYTEDSIIYNKDGTKYTGGANDKPSGTGFQHIRKLFTITNTATGAATITDKYMPIDAGILAEYATYDAEGGFWYIPKGAVYKETTRFREEKVSNPTGTLIYSDYPLVYHPATSTANDDYEIYDFLGNNGKLTLAPATGITLSKTVDAVVSGTRTDNFSFEIVPPAGVANGTVYNYTWEKADGTSSTGTFTVTDGKITISNVANGDVIHITGMAVGEYTVTELAHDEYKTSTVNGEPGSSVKITTANQTMQNAAFVNTLIEDGALIVGKNVVHNLGTGYVIPDNISFTAVVTLKDANGTAWPAGKTVTTSVGTKTTDEKGQISFTLKHDESVTVTELPEGTQYVVEETNLPAGFALDTTETTADDLAGTIQSDTTAVAWLTNKYTPDPADPEDPLVVTAITGTKALYGRDAANPEANIWAEDDTFAFQLQRWDGSAWVNVTGAAHAIDTNRGFDLSDAFKALDKQLFNAVGTYSFRVVELEGEDTDHIVYDNTHANFDVVITDANMDGELEIGNVIAREGAAVTKGTATEDGTEYTTFQVTMGFENRYFTSGFVGTTINIQKTVDNSGSKVDVPLADYEFGLYEYDPETKVTGEFIDGTKAVTDQDGKITIQMAYTTADNGTTKNYILKELPGQVPGITAYSKAEYHVAVTINDDGSGKLTQTTVINQIKNDAGEDITPTAVTTAAFENTYDPTDAAAAISGTKTLTNTDPKGVQDLLGNYTFTFELYETGSDFAVTGEPIDTDDSDTSGAFAFDELSYSAIGTHYYVVKERNEGRREIGYDDTEYHVTVSVAEGKDADGIGTGALVATTTIHERGGAGTAIAFENTYTPEKVTDADVGMSLGGTKTLEGRTQHHGEFAFQLTGGELTEPMTAVNAANTGKFQFAPITYTKAGTYTYAISEVVPAEDKKLGGVEYNVDNCLYTVTVEVVDDGEGELYIESVTYSGGTSTTEAAFRNTYEAKPVDVVIKATKTLTGRDLDDNEFEFAMYPADEHFTIDQGAVPTWTAWNVGNVATLTQTFTETGVSYYVLKEISDDPLGGVTYDTTRYNLIVTIFDVGNGQLSRTVEVVTAGQKEHYDHEDNDPFAFTNSYNAEDASVTLSGKKTLENRALKDGEFTFVLQELDKDGKKLGDPISVKNAADGSYAFTLDYDAAGTYYYTLSESQEVPSLDVAYDDTVYEITVTVTDDLKGKLSATVKTEQGAAANALNFTNTYDPTLTPKSGSAVVSLEKIVKSTYGVEVGLDGFQFSLQRVDEDGKAVGKAVTAETDDKGNASFSLAYNEKDIGKTFTYTLTEVNTGVKDMVYSTDSYTVTVKVTLGEDGKTIATTTSVTKGGQAVEAASFENVYNGQKDKPVNGSPTTGEDVRVMVIVLVMLVSMAGIVALILLRRKSSRR